MIIPALLGMACALLSALLGWFTLETLAGLATPPGHSPAAAIDDFVIVVPAHDEALGIGAMLRDLPPGLPRPRVLVVADNCADDTAAVARGAGVEVIERHDPTRKGKGFALAFARDHLAAHPPAAVMVLDADCRIVRGDPSPLAGRTVGEQAAVQAENLQHAGHSGSPLVRIGAFAFLIKNHVRARGLERLGGGTLLQGTGMVMAWAHFAQLELATASAVEDLELTAQLARLGIPVRLDARCRIESPAGRAAAHLAQRTRWEQGFVRNGLRRGLPMLLGGSRLNLAIGCHMLVPPLALLFLLASATVATGALLGWTLGLGREPIVLLAGMTGLAGSAVLIAWWRVGQATIPLGPLLMVPAYLVWKLPIYLALPFRRRVAWTRAERISESDANGGP